MEDEKRYIDQAVEHYRNLLTEQVMRARSLAANADTNNMSCEGKIIIGLIDGDGIGPFIMQYAKSVLEKILENEIAEGKVELREIKGLTIENRKKLGKSVPEDVLNEIKKCNVILKGPTETPKGGNLESANVTLRRELDLYANVRPVKLESEGIDWIFFRENTEGEYVLGSKGIEIPGLLTMDFKVCTQEGTRRICKAACEYAVANGKKNINIVTKANIMKKTDGRFSEICHQVIDEYPGLMPEDWYIDIMTAKLVNKTERCRFEVFVLPNLYGDIITDEAAEIQGGVGTAGSANIGDKYAMFEAIHGTAPRLIEEGLSDYANPLSILKAAAMMLRHIGYVKYAEKLEPVLEACTTKNNKAGFTGDKSGVTAAELVKYIKENI